MSALLRSILSLAALDGTAQHRCIDLKRWQGKRICTFAHEDKTYVCFARTCRPIAKGRPPGFAGVAV